MAKIIREISVDVAQLNRFQAIVAKQYDKQSRFLKVQLTNQDIPIFVDRDAVVTINARREDDAAKIFAGEVNDDGTVTVPLTYWMLELDGTVKCDISILVGIDTVLTTTLFELAVEEAAADDEAISKDDDYGLLVTLIKEVQTTTDKVTKEYQSSAQAMKTQYETSMQAAIKACEDAVTAAQLVTEPFFIVNNDDHNQYTAAFQIRGGKPVLVYDEFTS